MEYKTKGRMTLDEVRELDKELTKNKMMRLVKGKGKIDLQHALYLLCEEQGK